MDDTIWLDPELPRQHRRRIHVAHFRHFAHISLDRDEYVYQAQQAGRAEDAEVSPALVAAVGRFMDVASQHLWANGYAGTFSNNTGPSYVTIDVPHALAQDAADALRVAEIDGDTTGLDAIVGTLEVPVDAWLAPGERLLRQGLDFTCAPTAFLRYLRAQAERRGLRLNGRAVGGGVWVRPTMPRSNQELRQLFPEHYSDFADPAPYNEHTDALTGPWRPEPEPSYTTTPGAPAEPVTFLPSGLEIAGECPCGSGDRFAKEEEHAKAHAQWSAGVVIPRTVVWGFDDIAVVGPASPVAWRKLAYACALQPKRENGYDFASFSVGAGEAEEGDTIAYLYRAGRRVVGYVSVYTSDQTLWREWDSQMSAHRPDSRRHGRPVVNVIFTADAWRRQGIASELVRAVAADAGVGPAEVAWSTPFSDGGEALARGFAPDGFWIG